LVLLSVRKKHQNLTKNQIDLKMVSNKPEWIYEN
jgi:hypothetical protein